MERTCGKSGAPDMAISEADPLLLGARGNPITGRDFIGLESAAW
jgi:hypothetical protein